MSRKRKTPAAVTPPDMPPPSEEEQELDREIVARLNRAADLLRQRNLDNAVLLAQQAARGHGPLVDHFCELGRRYGDTLDTPQPPSLKVLKGGIV